MIHLHNHFWCLEGEIKAYLIQVWPGFLALQQNCIWKIANHTNTTWEPATWTSCWVPPSSSLQYPTKTHQDLVFKQDRRVSVSVLARFCCQTPICLNPSEFLPLLIADPLLAACFLSLCSLPCQWTPHAVISRTSWTPRNITEILWTSRFCSPNFCPALCLTGPYSFPTLNLLCLLWSSQTHFPHSTLWCVILQVCRLLEVIKSSKRWEDT